MAMRCCITEDPNRYEINFADRGPTPRKLRADYYLQPVEQDARTLKEVSTSEALDSSCLGPIEKERNSYIFSNRNSNI